MVKKVVLMYHDIYRHSPTESGFQDEAAFQYKIQVDDFESQVKAVVAYCKIHPNIEVEFTFDDGGISFLTLAAPILEKYGLRGIFFISTAYLNTPLFLTDKQLSELSMRGHRIGSHTHTHPSLIHLNAETVTQEWNKSVEYLKDFFKESTIASIPRGDVNHVVVQKAKDAGITLLYTSVPTIKCSVKEGVQLRGRYVIYQGMNVADVMNIVCSDKHRRLIYLRWMILHMAKQLLGNQYNSLKSFYFKIKH